MNQLLLAVLLLASPLLCLHAKHHGYSWKDEPGKHLDLMKGDKKIVRYVYERMDPKDRERTYKPFHHVYQADGEGFLTKGSGGKFTHHRGIYYGFAKCSALDADGKKVKIDTWHCRGGYQTHEKVLKSHADSKGAGHTVEIAWRVDDESIFATEERSLSFSHLKNGSLQVDFSSVLSTKQKSVTLDGDPQHAGFQFRASNEVATKNAKQTYYVRPAGGKGEMGKTKNWPGNKDMTNLPWKAQSVLVEDQRYFTVYLDHPNNPKPSFYSERDYGRFGSYFKTEATPNNPVKIKYRLVIGTKEQNSVYCESLSKEFSGK
jgi:hypothetical protein